MPGNTVSRLVGRLLASSACEGLSNARLVMMAYPGERVEISGGQKLQAANSVSGMCWDSNSFPCDSFRSCTNVSFAARCLGSPTMSVAPIFG